VGWAGSCEAVRQTISLYCQLLDDQRFGELAQLFTDDAELPWQGRTLVGREEIAREMHTTQEPLGLTRHLPFGSVIDLDGDTALVWTDVAVTLNGPGPAASIAWLGRYHDELSLTEGSWCFRRHVALAVGEALPEGVTPINLELRSRHLGG
jgi:hypothetical protein